MCHEVVTYPPDSPGSPSSGAWGTEDGYTMKMFFFDRKPGIQISMGISMEEMSMGGDPKDLLLFNGIEPVPGLNVSGLYFTRTVKPTEKGQKGIGEKSDTGILDRGFEEHTYFVKRRGLVRLEQKIGGKTSMLWTRTN